MRAAVNGSNTSYNFMRVAWLGQVIVSAIVQPENTVGNITVVIQQQNRDEGRRPNCMEKIEAGSVRQSHVENCQINVALGCDSHSRLKRVRRANGEAVIDKIVPNSVDEFNIVVDN
jgi:hypothetical protein